MMIIEYTLVIIVVLMTLWAVTEIRSSRAFERQVQNFSRAVYRDGLVKIVNLQEMLCLTQKWADIQPFVDGPYGLRTWWHSNNLSLDRGTEKAVMDVINVIFSPPSPDILQISEVKQALDKCVCLLTRNGGL